MISESFMTESCHPPWVYMRVPSHSVVSDILQSQGLFPARFFCPWDAPGKNTGAGCHLLLQRIFPTQESNSNLLATLSNTPQIIPDQRPCFLSTRKRRVVPDIGKRTVIVAETFSRLVWWRYISNASVWLEDTGERRKKKGKKTKETASRLKRHRL